MSLNLNGIIAALPTPFGYDGEVDHEKLRSNIDSWNHTDLLGYLILGSTGEFPHLTVDEKLSVIETVRSAMSPEKLLLVGTGELSTRQSVEMSRKAHELGADGGVVITPFYYKKVLEDEHHEAHYLRIADNSPMPILIYMIPQFAAVTLMPETIARLAEHPNIVGLKESSGDIAGLKELFRDLTASDFSVLVGSPAILCQGLDAGCAGGVLAVSALAPQTACAIEKAWRRGDREQADQLQKRLAALARVTAASGVGHLKAALDFTGRYGFLPRSPMPVPSEAELVDIEKAIEESGLFERGADGKWTERTEENAE
ncbi:MAG: dihydrodipicolinate synthase family protein [Blastocatellia bacterium]|nr:dihydrodipicolinate synthase family protein [Blastocatellia bacterium]